MKVKFRDTAKQYGLDLDRFSLKQKSILREVIEKYISEQELYEYGFNLPSTTSREMIDKKNKWLKDRDVDLMFNHEIFIEYFNNFIDEETIDFLKELILDDFDVNLLTVFKPDMTLSHIKNLYGIILNYLEDQEKNNIRNEFFEQNYFLYKCVNEEEKIENLNNLYNEFINNKYSILLEDYFKSTINYEETVNFFLSLMLEYGNMILSFDEILLDLFLNESNEKGLLIKNILNMNKLEKVEMFETQKQIELENKENENFLNEIENQKEIFNVSKKIITDFFDATKKEVVTEIDIKEYVNLKRNNLKLIPYDEKNKNDRKNIIYNLSKNSRELSKSAREIFKIFESTQYGFEIGEMLTINFSEGTNLKVLENILMDVEELIIKTGKSKNISIRKNYEECEMTLKTIYESAQNKIAKTVTKMEKRQKRSKKWWE